MDLQTSSEPPRGPRAQHSPLTITTLLQSILTEHPNAVIREIVTLVRFAANQLTPEDRLDLDAAGEHGREKGEIAWILRHLRRSKIKLKNVSARIFVAMLEEHEIHHWQVLSAVLETPDGSQERQQAAAHSWSVVEEASGMIREHRKLLLLYGEENVDVRIHEIVSRAFAEHD